MAGRRADTEPAALAGARARFESWRQVRSRGTRIPEALWELAATLAVEYGLSRTSLALKLDYYSLQERVESRKQVAPPEHAFVEVSAPTGFGTGDCTVELTDGTGACLRIHLKNQSTPDLIALTRSLWSSD